MNHPAPLLSVAAMLAAFALLPTSAAAQERAPQADLARVDRVLKETPLIDGHNDWAEARAWRAGDARWTMDLDRLDPATYDTDIERLRAGRVGGVFWSVYVPASLPGLEQVKRTLEHIDLVHQLAVRYPKVFAITRTAAQVRAAYRSGKIAGLIGVEGGGQIDKSFSVLRAYQALGAGYLTLTHFKTLDWADSATDDPRHDGLTPFGVAVVRELNRLGMLVDLSHVSEGVMKDAIAASRTPVIFSHSSARALCDHTRNVSDEVLKLVAGNGGIVMVNFAPNYVSEPRRRWEADRAGEKARIAYAFTGEPEKAKAALSAWESAHPRPVVTIAMVADHIDHIARIAGHEHVGIGADYDGLPDLPEGLEGVDGYPRLLMELMRRGWSDANLRKLAGENILRVMEAAEKGSRDLAGEMPETARIEALDETKRN